MSSTSKWVAGVVAAAALGTGLGYFYGHRSLSEDAQSGASSELATQAERKVLYWHDPMVPGTKFDKPGKSPFMDMQLVPVYADDVQESAVRVEAGVTQNLGIRLGHAERRADAATLAAVGTVVFDEQLTRVIQGRVAGYISRLLVKAPLEQVRKGQPLADIVAPEWLVAQQDYLALLDTQSASAQPIREAARQRLMVLGVPEASIQELEMERRTDATTTLYSPIDGVVSELSVREGAAFEAAAPLMRINGLATVWLNAQVPESQVSRISDGSKVIAQAPAWPGHQFQGRVLGVLPDVDPQTRTVGVRIAIDNAGRRLSPGMFVSVSFSKPDAKPELRVPSEAVIVTGTRNVVIVAREGGGFDAVNVETGAESDGWITILSGLEEDQSIVLSGQFLIDSEASLRSALDRLSSSPSDVAAPHGETHRPRDQP